MNKLNGTSGQLFSAIAETINARGMARSDKGAGEKAAADNSFQDLLHTVSGLAKRALNDQGSEEAVKAGTLRTRLAQLAEPNDETVPARAEAADEPASSKTKDPPEPVAKADVQARPMPPTIAGQELLAAVKPQAPPTSGDKPASSKKSDPPDPAKAEVQTRLTPPTIIGQELAAVLAVKPQAPPTGGDKRDAPARPERSSTARELSAASAVSAMKVGAAESGTRPVVDPQAATMPQGNALPKSASAVSGFEAVAADIEHAAKVSGREALPEATKVTVVQQETHLPPVPQFSATQQVANAVVSELKGASASASSAAPDLVSTQSNAPDQPLKILTINLEPPALGNVTVRLRLVGAEVSVHLAAERRDTSQMLEQQRDSIREIMQSAGYVADVAPVQHGALDGFQAGSGQSQPQPSGQQQPSQQSQGGFDGSGTSSDQSDGGAKQARQERQPNQETRHDQDVAPHIRRGPVYL